MVPDVDAPEGSGFTVGAFGMVVLDRGPDVDGVGEE